MFSKVVAAVGASVVFSGASLAADLSRAPARSPVYTNPTPVAQWDGFYVGIHGGYGWADADVRVGAVPGSGSPKGGFGGAQIGYNYMIAPNWLVGTEIDASFGDINDNTAPFAPSKFKVDVFGTARARLGYVQGPWLFYVTGGTAWAKPDWTAVGVIDNDRAHIGWAGGLGLEYLFAPNWSVKAEYLYADFGETRRNVGGTLVDTDLNMSMVRLGLNYHFGPVERVATASAMPVKAPVRTAARWTGAYVGVHGGYGWGDLDYSITGVPGSLDPNGAFGGIQTGYNWQFAPMWMVGIETDSSWGAIKDSGAGDKIEIDAMGTIRGRLGYVMNNTLLYGTGGLAWAHLDDRTGGGAVVSDRYLLGWTAGAGVEYQFAPRWSAKVEYAYMDFGTASETVGAAVLREKVDVHTVKVGLNYHASLLGLLMGR